MVLGSEVSLGIVLVPFILLFPWASFVGMGSFVCGMGIQIVWESVVKGVGLLGCEGSQFSSFPFFRFCWCCITCV